MIRPILTLMLLGCFLAMEAQTSLDDVRLELIPYRPVRKYLELQQEQKRIEQFKDVKASCADEDFEGFSFYSKTFMVKERLQNVWQTYRGTSPIESWDTRKSSVGLIYLRGTDEVRYERDTCNGINLGQIIFVNLKLVKGLYRMATAFEVTKVSEQEAVIEVSYIESGVNHGKQTIYMTETADGHTMITHTSVIRSDSRFRDKVLYPYFHNKLINVFHRQMKRKIRENVAMVQSHTDEASPKA